ncbi:GNAT family N-acetyltransferase [Kribbella voronezhensis]|nr:GNAT family N-acetyltransferase [Kribbella voronezhensis]
MLQIRPAVTADVEVVDEIAQSAFEHYTARIGRPPTPMSIDYRAAVEAGKIWVADDRSTVVGFVLLENEDDALLLDVIAVSPAAQGTGVGSALLTFTETEAETRGYSRITLYTNVMMTENLAYYPRHGYVETGRQYKNGFGRAHFEKMLAGVSGDEGSAVSGVGPTDETGGLQPG